jgi:hypothetical protein
METTYGLKNDITSNFSRTKDQHKRITKLQKEIDVINKVHTTLTVEDFNLLKATKRLLWGIILIDGAFGTALSFFILKYIFNLDPAEFNNTTIMSFGSGFALSVILIHTISFLVQRGIKRQEDPTIAPFHFFSKPQTPLYLLLVFPASTMLVVGRKLEILMPKGTSPGSGEFVSLAEYAIICIIAIALTFIVMLVVKEHAVTKVEEENKKLQSRLKTEHELSNKLFEVETLTNKASKLRKDIDEAITKLLFLMEGKDLSKENDFTYGFGPEERFIVNKFAMPNTFTGETVVNEQGELDGTFIKFWYSL